MTRVTPLSRNKASDRNEEINNGLRGSRSNPVEGLVLSLITMKYLSLVPRADFDKLGTSQPVSAGLFVEDAFRQFMDQIMVKQIISERLAHRSQPGEPFGVLFHGSLWWPQTRASNPGQDPPGAVQPRFLWMISPPLKGGLR